MKKKSEIRNPKPRKNPTLDLERFREAKSEKAKPKKAKADEAKEFVIPIYNMKGKEVESFTLNRKLFDGKVNKALLYQAVLMYNANQRQGSAATKTRGEVSGGGKKPWRQKGTGRARAGSTRSPLWRHGGTVFGPHPRDYSYSLPRKIKRRALLASINSKIRENKIMGIDSVDIEEAKTKKFQAVLDALKRSFLKYER